MLGVGYLFLCFMVGWAICSYAFPKLSEVAETAYDKRRISVSPYLLLLPAWFVTGVLMLTWTVYIIASLFRTAQSPLTIANAIALPSALVASIFVLVIRAAKHKKLVGPFLTKDKKTLRWEIILLAGIAVLAYTLMWTTFYVKEGQLHIGVTVFSDFSPHIGMIRSFSYGNNFPTAYSHFGGEDIRYHFMFQFLVGNLEFLGLRIDHAFNIPSILSFISAFLLLYLLAVKITGKRIAGFLSCLFFAFRSSKALFTYLSQIPKEAGILKTLRENTSFIGDTPNEDWGLWNLNVYCNQRHLAFGLTVLFFLLILFLPYLYEMFEAIKRLGFHYASERKKQNGNEDRSHTVDNLLSYIKLIFFEKEGWLVKDYRLPIAAGILLGSTSFFHGAVVIGCLLILFMVAVLSRRRLEFVIVAVLTLGLSILQTGYFIEGSAVTREFVFGFIAENKTFFGAASYLDRLLGILPLMLLAAFCFEKGIGRYLIFAFTIPIIFAFQVSLTEDVTVNHKYIMMSTILLGIFAAALLARIFERRDTLLRVIGVFLILLLTSTGIYDYYTVLRKNKQEDIIILDLEHPLTKFVRENSDSKDLFLTANYTINQAVLGGAMLFQGHQYYAWSAGYDTEYRDVMVRGMYQAQTPEELEGLVKENNIRYIIVDQANRESRDYVLNEANIRATYECVYEIGEGEWKTSVFDTLKPIY